MRIYRFKNKKSYYLYNEENSNVVWINKKLFFKSLSDIICEIQSGYATQVQVKQLESIEMDSDLVAEWEGDAGLSELYPEYCI